MVQKIFRSTPWKNGVGHSLKLLDIVHKMWALSENFRPSWCPKLVTGLVFAVWCKVVSRAGLFGSGRAGFGPGFRPGSSLSLSECFGPISGLHTQGFYTIRSNDFFLSWSIFVLLTVVTSMSEVIVIFLQLILFANIAAFFCSLLGLVSHSFSEGNGCEEISTRWPRAEKINHLRDSSLVLRNHSLQSGFSCL